MKDYNSIARKITAVLFASQSLSSAATIAAFTVNALVGVDLSGRTSMAGVPGALCVIGQACGSALWGFGMERMGRRRGMALGQVIAVLGLVIVIYAMISRSFLLFLAGLVLLGIGRAAVDLGRFMAAEVNLPEKRGRAISNVVLGSTIGAILGPTLVGPAGHLVLRLGFPELSGAYASGLILLFPAAILIFLYLRPDPRDIGRELAATYSGPKQSHKTRTIPVVMRQREVLVAMAAMVFAQVVMVVPMSITSVHMKMNHHPLTLVSLVISAHTLGMYAFSIISGRMTDKTGRMPVIVIGSSIMVLSCVMGAPSVSFLPLAASLFLLGLGWNFAYVGGSALLADQLSPGERARIQGFNDLLLNLASAASQAGSGVIYAIGGFSAMCMASAALATVPIIFVLWWKISSPRETADLAQRGD